MARKDEMLEEIEQSTPTDDQIAQANAESAVMKIAARDRINMDMQRAYEYQQVQQLMQQAPDVIGEEQVKDAMQRLLKYKKSKTNLDQRIVDNEQFFKLRHWEGKQKNAVNPIKPTAWLWNVILSKHSDMMDGYPEPNIRAKAEDDKQEAKMLSSIVPVVYEANGFYRTFWDCAWYKLIKGTACYGVFWDSNKNDGLGDISVEKVDILNLYWESGIKNIQDSREVFYVSLEDKDKIVSQYPQTKDRLEGGEILNIKKYAFDDTVDTDDKCLVVDWYYKKYVNGKAILHFCKFVNGIVLYATENDRQMPTAPVTDPISGMPITDANGNSPQIPVGLSMAESGLYQHGKYPFVLDPLFSIEGSPCGYSYIDICKHTQEDIDLLNHAIVNNAMLSARPRYFVRNDGSVNEKEFSDFKQDIVHCEGAGVGEDSIRLIDVPQIPSNVVNVLNNKIEELKETSGNRDVNNGSAPSSITAASAIAALQESSGKTSRDNLANTYEAYKEITYIVIELIRQFYNSDRQFRITGTNGQDEYVNYSNAGLIPQNQGSIGGVQLGYRVPQFDIEVNASKATAYSKMSQNELALQLYSAQVFAPNNADQALALLDIMDFDHKSDVIQKVQQNQTLMQINQQLLGIALGLAEQYAPDVAAQLSQTFMIGGQPQAPVNAPEEFDSTKGNTAGETMVNRAREQAQNSTQVS